MMGDILKWPFVCVFQSWNYDLICEILPCTIKFVMGVGGPSSSSTYGFKEFVGGSKPVINIPSIQTIFQVWIRRLNAILQRGLNERRPLRRCTRAVNPIPLNDPTSLLSQSWTLLPLQSSKPTVTCFSLHGRPISLSFPKTSDSFTT